MPADEPPHIVTHDPELAHEKPNAPGTEAQLIAGEPAAPSETGTNSEAPQSPDETPNDEKAG
jgi:hypothetical protein